MRRNSWGFVKSDVMVLPARPVKYLHRDVTSDLRVETRVSRQVDSSALLRSLRALAQKMTGKDS